MVVAPTPEVVKQDILDVGEVPVRARVRCKKVRPFDRRQRSQRPPQGVPVILEPAFRLKRQPLSAPAVDRMPLNADAIELTHTRILQPTTAGVTGCTAQVSLPPRAARHPRPRSRR